MKLHQSTTQIFVPNNKPVADALKRITHLGIGAHQDDLEFMASTASSNVLRTSRNGLAASPAPTARVAHAPVRMKNIPTRK